MQFATKQVTLSYHRHPIQYLPKSCAARVPFSLFEMMSESVPQTTQHPSGTLVKPASEEIPKITP